jgi:hypothetical protein
MATKQATGLAVVDNGPGERPSIEPKSKVLTAEDILGAQDDEYQRVAVPEWGGDVMLKIMSAADAIEFHRLSMQPQLRDEAIGRIVAMCACDEQGNKIFTTPEQIERLRTKRVDVFKRLQEAAMDLNGFERPGGPSKLAVNAKNGSSGA